MAKIAELLKAGRTFSFEFFPPKTDETQAQLVQTLLELAPLRPSFVSVTYGAGGTTRERTHDLVVSMLRITAMTPMAHLTCAAHSRLDLAEILVRYARAGMENILALGGDPPKDDSLPPAELDFADELVELARSIGGFSLGVAAHPEGHPRSPDLATDRRRLADKLRRADFAITQFFFDADPYLSMLEDLSRHGVDKPVIPGIMPVTNLASVGRMAAMSGTTMPRRLFDELEKAEASGGPDAVREVGIAQATQLCEDLLAAGAPGLHFYTLNRSNASREIAANLGL